MAGMSKQLFDEWPERYDRWFETPEGYLWAPYVFPMDFRIQTPATEFPGGKTWVEVCVPWVQGRIAPRSTAAMAFPFT